MSSDPFDILLRQSLNLTAEDEFLVIYDESLSPFWDAFLKAVVALGCSTTFVNVPIEFQHQLTHRFERAGADGPVGLWAAITDVDVILTVLSGDIGLAGVRKAIVNKAIGQPNEGRRLAHIPGISAEILDALTVSPLVEIERYCEALAWVLGEAGSATVRTVDLQGGQHVLCLDNLGYWEFEPLMSPGIISPSSWGNVPPGETFLCPGSRGVNGSIVIDGSVPGYVCKPDEQVILEFTAGKLRRWTTESTPLLDFFESQQRLAASRRDVNWNTFAELGIGANPAITELTGNSLFDEKAYGTAHIAIGDNAGFGFDVVSQIHADMVTRRPVIEVDGTAIVAEGKILAASIQRMRDSLEPAPVDLADLSRVAIQAERFEKVPHWPDGFARRLHRRGRTGFVRIASGHDATALRTLHRVMATNPRNSAPLVMMCEREGISQSLLARLLGLLAHYKMIYVRPDNMLRQYEES